MDVFVVRCVLGDLDAMAVVEVSVRLISRRRGSQGVGVRAVEDHAWNSGGPIQPATAGRRRSDRAAGLAIARRARMCGLGRLG
jgi:hypothetical protein